MQRQTQSVRRGASVYQLDFPSSTKIQFYHRRRLCVQLATMRRSLMIPMR